jgi:hypothetical protein
VLQVSEGIDFADDFGRAVIITGLPYPPLKDAKVSVCVCVCVCVRVCGRVCVLPLFILLSLSISLYLSPLSYSGCPEARVP